MIIIKIGGSAITQKDAQNPTMDEDNLRRIAHELSSYNDDMIIVHGAGSYGHIYAKKYAIGDVITTPQEHLKKIEGICKIQNSMIDLNYHVCSALQATGIPAISMKPSSIMTTNNKRIDTCDTTLIYEYLENGFVPVVYGDAVIDHDDNIKFAIISGDQLVTYLASKLNADRVILATDVDGIYTDNPKSNPNAKLLDVVTHDTKIITSANNQADVTGGMQGKINELLALADLGITSQIINAEVEGNIQAAISGSKVRSTIIK